MVTVTDLKERIDKLEANQLADLERWLDEREEWQQGKLNKKCFVIMPFSMTQDGRSRDYWTAFFDNFLVKSLAFCGYKAKRSEPTSGNIVNGIMEDLAWSDLVLAVLTDFNPNVWYELGVRHSLRRGGTILICQEDQIPMLPFDLKHHGVVAYKSSLESAPFVEQLRLQLDKCDGKTDDSPVSDFLHVGLSYCIHRALAGRRNIAERIGEFEGVNDVETLKAVDGINQVWANQELQVSIIKDDILICHQGGVAVGTAAILLFTDTTMDKQSHYPSMKASGRGIWVGSIPGHIGRLTAVAYETLPNRGWIIAVEAHAGQGDL